MVFVRKKKILIVGTGALATLFAARFSSAGLQVTMLGSWKHALDALNTKGARLLLPDGSWLVSPVLATNDPADCLDSDLAVVLVKAWQTQRSVRQLAACLPADCLVVTLQNGLGNHQILAESLGSQRVVLGVTTTGATLLEPGIARLGGEGLVSLGFHPRHAEITGYFQQASISCEVVADTQSLIWSKLVVSAAINPLTALLRIPNGELLNRPMVRDVMSALIRETVNVASAQGIKLAYDDPWSVVEQVVRATASNHSSMFQDIQRGAPTEIDAICGEIVQIGEASGVQVPVNTLMWQLIHSMPPG
jgi:2-dehydropantoate 2-reductase